MLVVPNVRGVLVPNIFGLMGVALAAAKARQSGKGRAVPERLHVDPPSLADQSGASS